MTDTAHRVHTYQPRGVCRELFECRDPEVLISGPAGTGKSRACLEKVHAMALANPGMQGLLVRKTAVSLTATGIITWESFVIPESVEAGAVEYFGGSKKEPPGYRYANGSRISMGGMDKATRIMSSEYDVIYVQEATELTETDWESLSTRLRAGRVSFQQLLADCNPDMPTHWLKKRCASGATREFASRHEDNPVLYDDHGRITERGAAYMDRLERLTGTRYQRLRKGLWTGAEGLVYTEFDPAVHLIDRRPIPDDWPRLWTVDFGFVNPFCCQHWAINPDGGLVLYREFYGTRRLVSEWADTIMATVTDADGVRTEPKPYMVVCDHDAEGREQFARGIRQRCDPAVKRVTDGIQAVQERLRDRRLVILRDALHEIDEELQESSLPVRTADEFAGYVWQDTQVKETPVKQGDHGLDALRYAVASVDLGHRPRLRTVSG